MALMGGVILGGGLATVLHTKPREQLIVIIAEYVKLFTQYVCGSSRVASPGLTHGIESHRAFVSVQSQPRQMFGVAWALKLRKLRPRDAGRGLFGAFARGVVLVTAVKATNDARACPRQTGAPRPTVCTATV